MRALRLILGLTPVWLSILACLEPAEDESEHVGDFVIVGLLERNECGASAVPAQDLIEQRVQVRRDGAHATWRAPNAAIVHGVNDRGSFRFSLHSQIPVHGGDPDFEIAPCTLEQVETIEVTLTGGARNDDAGVAGDAGVEDAGAEDAGAADDAGVASDDEGLEGSSTVRIRPVVGGTCAQLVAVNGGPFDRLPCDIRYRLRGTPSATPLF